MTTRRVDLTGPNTHRTGGQSDAGKAERQARAYDLRLSGLTIRQIAAELGVSYTTVHGDLRREIHERIDPLKDQYLQYELDRLDAYQRAALAVLENPGTPVQDFEGRVHVIMDDKKILGAIDRLVKISESRRKLCGLDAPVKVQGDVTVTETTQEDLELQELIREAKVKAAQAKEDAARFFGEQGAGQ